MCDRFQFFVTSNFHVFLAANKPHEPHARAPSVRIGARKRQCASLCWAKRPSIANGPVCIYLYVSGKWRCPCCMKALLGAQYAADSEPKLTQMSQHGEFQAPVPEVGSGDPGKGWAGSVVHGHTGPGASSQAYHKEVGTGGAIGSTR